jgi:hypothetical protein
MLEVFDGRFSAGFIPQPRLFFPDIETGEIFEESSAHSGMPEEHCGLVWILTLMLFSRFVVSEAEPVT